MSTNKEKLIERLTSTKDGMELVDVKFSLGNARYISQEAFCGEVLNGLEEVASGLANAVEPSAIDGSFNLRTTAEFLA